MKPWLQHHMWLALKSVTLLLANNKGTDQPAHPRSLISAFVFRYLKSKVTIFQMSRDMRFTTMLYVQPAKPQISLRIRAV